MKSTFALSLSLIAFSGGAGLGLSAFHDFTTSVQTASLTSPVILNDANTGFVAPQFVPARYASKSKSALTAPVQPDAFATPDPAVRAFVTIRPKMRPQTVAALAPSDAELPTKSAVAIPRLKAALKSTVPSYKPAANAPIYNNFMAQPRAKPVFTATKENAPTNPPKYIVGVYR